MTNIISFFAVFNENPTHSEIKDNIFLIKGADGINPFFLRKCAIGMALPLSLIYCKPLEDGEIPEAWCETNVTQLFKKKGSRSVPANFRPV